MEVRVVLSAFTLHSLWKKLQQSPATDSAFGIGRQKPSFADNLKQTEIGTLPAGLTAMPVSEPIARWAHHQRMQRMFTRRASPPKTPRIGSVRRPEGHRTSARPSPPPRDLIGMSPATFRRRSGRAVPTLYRRAMTVGAGSAFPEGARGELERAYYRLCGARMR